MFGLHTRAAGRLPAGIIAGMADETGGPKSRGPLLPLMPETGTKQDVEVLCDFGGATLESRTRTSAAGNTAVRYSMSIKADPILHNLSQVDLGRGPAEAIVAILQRQFREVSERVRPATELKRAQAVGALARGAAWAVRRYTGGKTGGTAPNQSSPPRMFNDSGRLRGGIFARWNALEAGWTINVPANRLDPATFPGGTFQAMVQRLTQLVPAFGGGDALMREPEFARALANSNPIKVLTGESARIWAAYRKAGGAVIQSIGGALRPLL